jgi:hypothetical protein
MNELIPQKITLDIEDLKKAINGFAITDSLTMQQAAVYTSNIKRFGALLKELKDKASEPYKTPLNAILERFKPYEAVIKQSEVELKGKLVAYQKYLDDERDKKIPAMAKEWWEPIDFNNLPDDIEKNEENKLTGMYFKNKKELVIVDESLIPDEYWIIDRKKLEYDVFKWKKVPGAKISFTKTAVVKK